MALGALIVPALFRAGPVKAVLRCDVLIRVKMVPALPALGAGPRIPGHTEGLEFSIGKFDQVLLEGGGAKRVGDLIVVQLSVFAFLYSFLVYL